MIQKIHTKDELVAMATLEQINNICGGADNFQYEPHPLLTTRDTSCKVKIEPVTITQEGVQKSTIHFNLLDRRSKSDITSAQIELLSSGRVDMLSNPFASGISKEKREKIHYVQEFVFPPELMEAIITRPAEAHELTTSILATESLHYFIDTSHRNRHHH